MYIFVTSIGKNGENVTNELQSKMYKLVCKERRIKADKLKSDTDKKLSLAAGVLLNVATGIYKNEYKKDGCGKKWIYTEIPLEKCIEKYDEFYDYKITTGLNGKPEYENGIYFNISHSGEYVVCAIGDKAVGVDIEGDRKINLNTAKRFFTQVEYNWICGNEMSKKDEITFEQKQRFLRIWTLKEAYSKMTGVGIAYGISKIEFLPGDDGRMTARELQNPLDNKCINKHINKYEIMEYEIKQYRIAVIAAESMLEK